MRRRLVILLVILVFGGLVSRACWAFHLNDLQTADFLMKVAISLGTVSAILCALYGDFFRTWCDPIRIEINVPTYHNNVVDECKHPDDGRVYKVFCHHLVAKNLTPHRRIENCQVWLKRMFVQGLGNSWEERTISPVRRLMEWAPANISKEKRTFTNQDVFDLGKTYSNNKGFELTFNAEQGGAYPRHFPTGQKLGLVFEVTAENYAGTKEFFFEIDVNRNNEGDLVQSPARVSKVKKPHWRQN